MNSMRSQWIPKFPLMSLCRGGEIRRPPVCRIQAKSATDVANGTRIHAATIATSLRTFSSWGRTSLPPMSGHASSPLRRLISPRGSSLYSKTPSSLFCTNGSFSSFYNNAIGSNDNKVGIGSSSSSSIIITRAMSKYVSKSAKKRLPLTTKRARKGFYKGKGGTKEGRLTSKGRFIVNPLKRLELVVPENLDSFRLKPYIAASASKFPPEERHSLSPTSSS